MTKQEKLLNKYYSGETSLKEEEQLKTLFEDNKEHSSNADIFGYYKSESKTPENLEEDIFNNVISTGKKRKSFKMRLYTISSIAAIIAILLTVYLDFRSTRNIRLENDFFLMEQALFQISESIQPTETDDMLVLWIDNDVEIIIN